VFITVTQDEAWVLACVTAGNLQSFLKFLGWAQRLDGKTLIQQ